MAFALLPLILGRDWWDACDYPDRIMYQRFGDNLLDTDFSEPVIHRGMVFRPRTQESLNASGKSEVCNDSKIFKVSLDVSQFKLEELEVKIVNGFVVVHGKHEENCDDHGFIAREFTRKYMLPTFCKQEETTVTITPENILMIQAPKLLPEEKPIDLIDSLLIRPITKEEKHLNISRATK